MAAREWLGGWGGASLLASPSHLLSRLLLLQLLDLPPHAVHLVSELAGRALPLLLRPPLQPQLLIGLLPHGRQVCMRCCQQALAALASLLGRRCLALRADQVGLRGGVAMSGGRCVCGGRGVTPAPECGGERSDLNVHTVWYPI